VLTPEVVRIETIKGHELGVLGSIQRIVRLENHPESMLGSVTRVAVDEDTGDLFVGDFDATRTVYRFGASGNYIQRYRVSPNLGPVLDFTLLSGAVIVQTSQQLTSFDRQGEQRDLTLETVTFNDLVAVGNTLYARVVANWNSATTDVIAFDQRLKQGVRFGRYDPRLERYAYITRPSMATIGDRVCVSAFYDLSVTCYDQSGRPRRHYTFPNQNANVRQLLENVDLTENDRTRVKSNIHRFEQIYGIGANSLFLYEWHKAKSLYEISILDMTKNTRYRFVDQVLYRSRSGTYSLPLSRIVGSFEGGIIGTTTDSQFINDYTRRHAATEGRKFTETDNPVLVFLELRRP
jgi:hypothetical protein